MALPKSLPQVSLDVGATAADPHLGTPEGGGERIGADLRERGQRLADPLGGDADGGVELLGEQLDAQLLDPEADLLHRRGEPAGRLPVADLGPAGLQLVEHVNAYRHDYNHVRPHEAIAWNRPADVYAGTADPTVPNFETKEILPTT